jgi:multidrug efflux pump subunit AcrB
MGKNLPILKQASDRLQNWLRKIDGLDDIYDDLRPGKQELHVELLDSAKSLGVNSLMVASQLRAAFQGEIANEIQVGIESIEVTARLEKKSNLTLAILDQFTIRTNDGREVPLTNITRITEKSSWAKISRVDGQRTVSVYGEVDIKKANVEELINTAKNEIIPEIETKFPGVTVVADGQVKNTADTMVTMQRAMILGVIGVFLILSYQFRSWFEPLLVMAIIPFSMIGVVIGHMIMGFDLAMPSIMGFISLAGVVVNDSILLVEFVHLNASKGEKIIDAAIKASLTRVRPILLTSLTTIAGMLPLLFESSLQAQILQPLVISLVFGLTAATLMVLFLVPCLYAILDDFGFFVHRIT